jgi:hypothetical protein
MRTMKSRIPNKKIDTEETTRVKTSRELEIRLDDKLLKVSVMVSLSGKNKGLKIHNTIFIFYFYFYKKNKNQKRENKKVIEP